jgi:AAA family ATP:ADP antiporter
MRRTLATAVNAEPAELKACLLAFAYFFFLMAGYYVLRPLRDTMAVAGGVDKLPWLFTGSFTAMLVAAPLFSALATRTPRHRFIPICYRFFAVLLLGFWVLFEAGPAPIGAARAFFIATAVYNLFVVSIFWSFMADIFRHGQGARLFGFIAAGGTAGALVGPLLTTLLVKPVGPTNLLLISVAMLEACTWCVRALHRWSVDHHGPIEARREQQPLGGDLFSGIKVVFRSPFLIGIALYVFLLTTTSTFLYLEQAQIVVKAASTTAERTAVFARIDLVVNVLTLLLQGFVTGRLIRSFGVRAGLGLLPVLTALGFVALALAPTLLLLTVVQGVRRAAHFGIERPTREILFIDVDREQKYKSKNFIDTVVYRGGDAVTAWISSALSALGLGVVPVAAAAMALCGVWLWNALALARKDRALEAR